jgi:hypothetical protein
MSELVREPSLARRLVLQAAIASAATTVLQVTWLDRVKLALADETPVGSSPGVRRIVDAVLRAFGWDAALALLVLVVVIAAALRTAQIAARGPSGLAALVPKSAPGRLVLMLVATWAFVRWHAAPGALFGADLGLHAAQVSLVADEIGAGRWPSYTDAWYLGFPILRHCGAAFYLPAGALAAAIGDVRTAVVVVAAAWHLAAAPAAFRLARTVGASTGVALATGIAYAACPAFAFTLGHVGSLTAAPIIALAPYCLSEAIRTGRGESLRAGLRLGASLALCAWADPAYATQIATLAALALVAAAATSSGSFLALLRAATAGGLAVVVAALGALPLLWSWFVDALPRAGAAPAAAELVRPGPPNLDALRQLLAWSPRPDLSGTGYVGVVVLLLALVGFLRPGAGAARPWLGALLAATVIAWCGPGLDRERALLLFPVTIIPLIAAGLGGLAAGRARAALLVGALVVADLVLGSLLSPHRADLDPLARGLAAEAASQGTGRTILLSTDREGTTTVCEWQLAPESPLRVLTGGSPREGAPAAHAMCMATLDAVASDPTVRDAGLRRHLAALGVVSVRRVARRRLNDLKEDAVRLPAEPRIRFAPSFAFHPAVRPLQPDQVLAWVAAMVGPEGSSPAAWRRVIFAGEGSPLPAQESDAPIAGAETLADRREGPRREAVVRVPSPGWLRFDDAWMPGLRATVDGREVRPLADVFGLVVIPIAAMRDEATTWPAERRVVLELPERWWPFAGPLVVIAALLVTLRRRGAPRGARAAGATEGRSSGSSGTGSSPPAPESAPRGAGSSPPGG